jgi:hypothetical protein
MASIEEVSDYITNNILDSSAWDKAIQPMQEKAVATAERNLSLWYPSTSLTVDVVAGQAIWELQGLDPALKLQKQGVKSVGSDGESITYRSRDKIAPDVREVLGNPSDERLQGGVLL